MKKYILFFALFLVAGAYQLEAQKYFTRAGNIHFSSDASLEKIEATNASATSVLDTESGRIEFAVLIKGFQFEKALMQEHFNENYMESDEFPKSIFKGNIKDVNTVDWTTDGEYPVEVSGDLTIHGVTKPVSIPAQIIIVGGAIKGNCTFQILVADYDIKIPTVVKDNIAKEVEIKIDVNYEPLVR